MPLEINARLSRDSFAPGETIPLLLSVANPGREPVVAVDPRQAGSAFRLRFGAPGTQPRTVSIGEVQRRPGVPDLVAQLLVPPEQPWEFEFDVAELTGASLPGTYEVAVEYEWKAGETWRSDPMRYNIAQPAGTFLEAVPAEGLRCGYHALAWGEAAEGGARVLMLDFHVQKPPRTVRGAVEVARVTAGVSLALSMSPAAAPFPDRWMAWTSGGQLYGAFCAAEEALPARPLMSVGADREVVRPLLAGTAPGEGRPGCLAGLLLPWPGGAEVLAVEITGNGEARTYPPVGVTGSVRGSWATAPASGRRIFVLALTAGQKLEIVSVEFPAGRAGAALPPWISLDAGFLAGDVRAMPHGRVAVGLLVERAGDWERVAFLEPVPGQIAEPAVAPLKVGPGAKPVRARLDGTGRLHVLFLRDGLLHYVPPGSESPAWSDRRLALAGKFFDLVLAPNGAALLACYDNERGAALLRI